MENSPKPFYTCFVIMPFSDTAHEVAGAKKTTSATEWTNIYQDWIKKAVESYPDANITCERSATAAGNFVKGIVGSLNDSDFVIADLTGNKPNVYYELGIRHALRTGTIIITQHRSALPSDLQTYYCLEYEYSSAHHEYTLRYTKFEGEIHNLIKTILAQNFSSDSPVSDFLDYRSYSFVKQWIYERDEFLAQLERILKVASEFREHVKKNVSKNDPSSYDLFDHYRIDLHLAKIFNFPWKAFDLAAIEGVTDMLLGLRSLCERVNVSLRIKGGLDIETKLTLQNQMESMDSIDPLLASVIVEAKKQKPPAT